MPSFERAGSRGDLSPVDSEDARLGSVYTESAEVILRLNVRSLRSGRAFTWVTSGGGFEELGWGRAASLSLEAALRAMGDSLGAHRAELEVGRPVPP